jgi:anti-sigma factor RsiW
MADPWMERLSEYLDGELAEDARAQLEVHLAGCPACREALEGLRGVVARAQALEDRPPAAQLWSAIAERIGAGARGRSVPPRQPRAGRGVNVSLPRLLAAGIALAMVSAGAAWVASRAGRPPAPVALEPGRSAAVAAGPVVDLAAYDATVAELERVLVENRDRLAPATVEALEQSLATIDRAIEEARVALEADPASKYLNSHLANTMRRKVLLLSRAVTLARET